MKISKAQSCAVGTEPHGEIGTHETDHALCVADSTRNRLLCDLKTLCSVHSDTVRELGVNGKRGRHSRQAVDEWKGKHGCSGTLNLSTQSAYPEYKTQGAIREHGCENGIRSDGAGP